MIIGVSASELQRTYVWNLANSIASETQDTQTQDELGDSDLFEPPGELRNVFLSGGDWCRHDG